MGTELGLAEINFQTWEIFCLFLLLCDGKMLVFYLIFQISCLFPPDLNSALQFSLATKKHVAFVCRAQEWKWNGHFLGVCYSRRGCSKLKNVMDTISLGSCVISAMHFSLPSASICNLKSRPTTDMLKLLFFPPTDLLATANIFLDPVKPELY